MSHIESTIRILEGVRERTLATCTELSEMENTSEVLGFRPGAGRAHIAWQLMHVGITEDLFATERLVGAPQSYPDLSPRFRGGSTPDDDIPSMEEILGVLEESRQRLIATLRSFSDQELSVVPDGLRERGWTVDKALQILVWHEAHHQGQAHLSLNLLKAARSS